MSRGECYYANENCKYWPKPYSDIHHLDWPSTEYQSKTEKAYRAARTIRLCRCLHDFIHLQEPPEKPSPQIMREYLSEVDHGEITSTL